MDYATVLNSRSAGIVVNRVAPILEVDSVVDFGCAQGSWLSAWSDAGVSDIQGVDGPYVDVERLLIAKDKFRAADLAEPLDLGRTFDLAQSVEVAEHLPTAASDVFVETMTRHAPLVLFGAAPPGQGGRGHINEQPYSFWRDRFAQQGYAMFDFLRPQLKAETVIQPWYRYNLFLFASADACASLPNLILDTQVAERGPVADVSAWPYRVRKGVIRMLPQGVQNILSDVASAASRRKHRANLSE